MNGWLWKNKGQKGETYRVFPQNPIIIKKEGKDFFKKN